ncbi:TonB-dependent receptor [Vibrio tapetis subsp. quintayensis]|uniref:TonB-dependent receptor n=1 Tax=Vibrio tapetis TaxID=52443 RepID=UPI0025B3E9EA|nr:TonB-dependent receptor [Vibrio tapetis]MDN3679690.1 TonB-dependent receptor [Vibrio tapetis subsp. quintayensis]
MNKSCVEKTVLASAIFLAMSSFQVFAAEALDVMVIESTKFETPLSQVNNSVLIKTGDELEKAGIYAVKDLEKVFPGLLIQARGNQTYSNTTIRGISSPDYYSPTVSVYVDGILQDNSFISQQLINVKRVELLRGPQGTLYGGNAQGGVINIITQKASPDRQLRTSALYSNLSKQIDAVGSVPVSDALYADVSARYVYDEGNIDHTPSGKKNANNANDKSLKTRLHYMPEDSALSATLSVMADKLDSHEEWYLSEKEHEAGATNTDVPNLTRDVYTYSLNLGYDFGHAKLNSITAFQDRKIDREYAFGRWEEDQNKFTQELRLNTRFNESLLALIGGYFEDRDLKVDTGTGINKLDYQTYALFGQGNYQLTETVDLTLGARASHSKVKSEFGGNTAWHINPSEGELTENMISPKAALGWQALDDTRVYLSLTSGYRPGGYNVIPLSNKDSKGYKAETSLNAELGWRTSLLDDMLDFSGALYWIKTNDVQIYTGVVGSQSLENMGVALSQGLEAELAFYATDDLTISLGGTHGSSTFRSNNAGLSGNKLPYAPDTTVTLGGDYYLPQSWVEGDIFVASQARYTSTIYFDEKNTLSQGGYTLVDLSLNYDYNKDFSVSLFANNLTDKNYVTYAFSYGGTYSNYGTGREVGVKARYDW